MKFLHSTDTKFHEFTRWKCSLVKGRPVKVKGLDLWVSLAWVRALRGLRGVAMPPKQNLNFPSIPLEYLAGGHAAAPDLDELQLLQSIGRGQAAFPLRHVYACW